MNNNNSILAPNAANAMVSYANNRKRYIIRFNLWIKLVFPY